MMHVREHGTKVWSSLGDSEVKIEACRSIVKERQYAKVDGFMVDLFSASHVVAVYDALSEVNRNTYLTLPIQKMVRVAFKLTTKETA